MKNGVGFLVKRHLPFTCFFSSAAIFPGLPFEALWYALSLKPVRLFHKEAPQFLIRAPAVGYEQAYDFSATT
ncbi:hypothetical protein [Mucilaginibacter lappiensis]|uniref:hypothetical protein n=1 Tax=Mucilaginibacter lappiensis TaxID=354630 RepID=UPI003D23EE23